MSAKGEQPALLVVPAQNDLRNGGVTSELARRPQRAPDYEGESRELASLLEAGSEREQLDLLPQQIVEAALRLCRAASAGFSVLDGDTICWQAVAGAWAGLCGRSLPRRHSPCGLVLDHDTVLLLAYPARQYPLAQATPEAVEQLLLPIRQGGQPLGALWVVAHDAERHFDAEDLRLLESLGRVAVLAQQRLAEYTALLQAQHKQEQQRQQAALYRSVVEHLPNSAAFVVDHTLRYRLAGGQALTDAQLAPSDFEGKALAEAVDPAQLAEYTAFYRQALAGQPFSIEHHSSARHYVSQGIPLRDEAGAIYAALAVSHDITARRQVELALQASEERYRSLFSAIDEGFCIIEMLFDTAGEPHDYRFVEVNPAFERQSGLRNPVGKRARELVPDLEAHWFAIYGAVARSGLATRFSDESSAMNRWFDVYAFPVGAPHEAQVAVLFSDISLRRQAEARAQDATQQLWDVLESISDMFYAVDSDWRLTYVNRQVERAWGKPRAELQGKMLWDIFPNYKGTYGYEMHMQAMRAREPMSWEVFSPMMHMWVEARAYPSAAGLSIYFHDISSRKAAEQALAERERLLDLLLKISDAARALSNEQAIVRATCGLVKQELAAISCSYGLIYPAQDRVLIVADVCDTEDGVPSIEGEMTLSRFGGPIMALHLAGEPVVIDDTATHAATADVQAQVFDPMHTRALISIPLLRDGGLVAYFAVHHRLPRHYTQAEVDLMRDVAARIWDAVQRVRAEAALRASEARQSLLYAQERAARAEAEEANRLKDEFLATVSHELRTPLTAFFGYAQMLQSRPRDQEYVARTVEKMVRTARVQAQLIEDLLDVSRITSGKLHIQMQPLSLITVLQAALDTVRSAFEAKGIEVTLDLDPQASEVIGDAGRLQQVVWNLLSNAAKFTPPQGCVHMRLRAEGDNAELTVRDSGVGISADFLPFVFDRFRQADATDSRSQGGLGLGLAIVRHLVDLHGGSVYVSSPGTGQGTTFTVLLPR